MSCLSVPAPSEDDARRERALAFSRQIEPEIEVLLRVARTLTGSPADAEDLVQETLIRAFRAVDRFDGRHPRAWLLTILRNTNMNLHRRQRPQLLADRDGVRHARPAFGVTHERGPEEVVLDEIMEEDLERALASLNPRFRRVLLLVDVDRLTYAEAAEALDVPVGTVMSRLHRARERVRGQLRQTTTTSRRAQ